MIGMESTLKVIIIPSSKVSIVASKNLINHGKKVHEIVYSSSSVTLRSIHHEIIPIKENKK